MLFLLRPYVKLFFLWNGLQVFEDEAILESQESDDQTEKKETLESDQSDDQTEKK